MLINVSKLDLLVIIQSLNDCLAIELRDRLQTAYDSGQLQDKIDEMYSNHEII